MSIVEEFKETKRRFSQYITRFISLCEQNDVKNLTTLLKHLRQPEFRARWNAIWKDLAETEGGKISFTTAAIIVGLILGGVGIAAGGGAVGLPMVLLLTPVAYFTGQELDSEGWTKKTIEWARKVFHFRSTGAVEVVGSEEAASNLENNASGDLALLLVELTARCEELESQSQSAAFS
jgi:hypothetical protein